MRSTPNTPSSQRGDRFIPHRGNFDSDVGHHLLMAPASPASGLNRCLTPTKMRLQETQQEILQLSATPSSAGKKRSRRDGGEVQQPNIINCSKTLTPVFERMAMASSMSNIQRVDDEEQTPRKLYPRQFPTQASRVLDAVDLENDYYLNLLHWGATDLVAIALGASLYIYSYRTGETIPFLSLRDKQEKITSLQWSPQATLLAVGTSASELLLYDSGTGQRVRSLHQHQDRIASLAWAGGGEDWLSSGGRDSMIYQYDLRSRQAVVSALLGHTQEVCGLAWSLQEPHLLASGGNENMLCVWESRMSPRNGNAASATLSARSASGAPTQSPWLQFPQAHEAAVKALTWCPFQRQLLASGGGTADRCIKLWNFQVSQSHSQSRTDGVSQRDGMHQYVVKTVDTGSQVCALQWIADSQTRHKELVSSHGYTDNQLIIWRFPDMAKMHELRGHSERVLHLAKSPDAAVICSASADETLRFWEMYDGATTGPASARRLRNKENCFGLDKAGFQAAMFNAIR